ncbi:MAG TPA: TetR/AcrR family transcriptional regulator [Homoserinimonas sp.]|nr:TetR/AcrR family transcriptional regulator [Homoserinimonas sp.]
MAQALGTPLRNVPIGQRRDRASVRRDELIDELIELFIRDGFLALSIEDIARELKRSKSTLYSVADSKEQIFVAVARAFFRRATARIEERLKDADQQTGRIGSYLKAISDEFASASPQYFADLDAFAPTRDIYRANMDAASQRVQDLVLEAVPETSRADATFLGTVAAQIMEAVHRGEIEQSTGLEHPAAYRALGNLIEAGVTASAREGKL